MGVLQIAVPYIGGDSGIKTILFEHKHHLRSKLVVGGGGGYMQPAAPKRSGPILIPEWRLDIFLIANAIMF